MTENNNDIPKILVVEDNKTIKEMLNIWLNSNGFEVINASNGFKALELISSNNDISLALTDISMPDMDGMQLLTKIREKYSLSELPVLMVTSKSSENNILQAFSLGANDYVIKPFDFTVLLARIKTHLLIKNLNCDVNKKNIKLNDMNLYLQKKLEKTINIVQFSNKINNLDYNRLISASEKMFPLLFDAILFSIFLYDQSNLKLKLISHNHQEWSNLETPLEISEDNGIMWEAFRTHSAIILSKFSKDINQNLKYRQKYADDTAIILPIMVSDKILGIINLNNISDEDIEEENLASIQIVVNQFALALNNSLQHKKIEQLSLLDELTQLYNRRHLYRILELEMQRINRYAGQLSILLLDIDFFKKVNDTYGHNAGDAVLMDLAQYIKKELRSQDIACRYGGEEFLIILPHTSKEHTFILAERIRMRISVRSITLNIKLKQSLSITISIGVSEYKKNETINSFIERADAALYAAKNSGRNKCMISE